MCYVAEVREPVLGHRWPLIDLGLERAGMECAWQVEIDPFRRKVLARHWPGVPRYEDVRDIDYNTIGAVDLVCGGVPCQPASVAGRRRGSADERWLWPEFLRAVREIRPRWVVAENPPGLLSVDAGRAFGGILRELAACGYDAGWNVLSAAAFGAPHLRERVWLIAYPHQSRHGQLFQQERQPERHFATYPGRTSPFWAAADIDSPRELQPKGEQPDQWGRPHNGTQASPDAVASGREDVQGQRAATGTYRSAELTPSAWWDTEPGLLRLVHGVRSRVDKARIEAAGDAIVPQCAEWIGRRILAAESVTP